MNELDNPTWGAKPNPLIARFRTEAVKMEFASAQAGRPIYEDREFVEIIVPGNRGTVTNEPVRDEHKERWPREYAAFKAGQEAPLEGTPLKEWPSSKMTRARVEELAYFNIRTVEQLAAVNDGQLQHLGMGARAERDAARTFLEVALKGTGPLERLLSKVEMLERDNELKASQIAAQAAQIADLTNRLKEPA